MRLPLPKYTKQKPSNFGFPLAKRAKRRDVWPMLRVFYTCASGVLIFYLVFGTPLDLSTSLAPHTHHLTVWLIAN